MVKLNENEVYDLFLKCLKKYSVSEIAKKINVANGTITRWKTLQKVPYSYVFDLLRLNNENIDYSIYSYQDKDQFFTSDETAKKYIEKTFNILSEYIDLNEYIFVEPSAGDGVFLKNLPSNSIGIDIESTNPNVIISNYFDWTPDLSKKYIVIGNPPFGLRGQKALQFIQKSFEFADFVCFILPPLFNSDGKGSPKKRISQNLIFSENIENNTYHYPSGENIDITTIFQIWTRLDIDINLNETYEPHGYKIYSLSDGGTPSTTRNKNKLNCCDYYLPSTVFDVNKVYLYKDFNSLPQRRGYGIVVEDENVRKKIENIDWKEIAFYSTNGASNLRTSLITEAIETYKIN